MQVFAALTRAAHGVSASAGFVRRHGRLTVLLVVVALLAVPLLRGGDVGAFALNALGTGLAALALRRLLRLRLRWPFRR